MMTALRQKNFDLLLSPLDGQLFGLQQSSTGGVLSSAITFSVGPLVHDLAVYPKRCVASGGRARFSAWSALFLVNAPTLGHDEMHTVPPLSQTSASIQVQHQGHDQV